MTLNNGFFRITFMNKEIYVKDFNAVGVALL